MRVLKGLIVGALAFGGLALAHSEASAGQATAPSLIDVRAVTSEVTAAEAPCQWHHGWRGGGWHRGGWGYRRWHPHPYWGPRYGWHRHWGYRRHWRHYY